ncbi:MAG TPA: MBL fold metallo-hydrolase [Gaiellaceae bacterium]|jgi:glyoxylase-like metal-dependent hydrolase (beta-lactamase superfamily II)
MDELPAGIRRLTFPLPLGIDHVHCYLLPGEDGWTLVDTGLGLPDARGRWEEELRGVEVARIVITHFHPDHVGGARDVHELTGAPVFEGVEDYRQAERVWGSGDWSDRLADYLGSHGLPERVADELRHESRTFSPFIRFAPDPEPLREGDEVDGWRVLELPGHADGHLCLERDGVLVAGDHLLGAITPTVGLYPESRPDPLADYQASLRRTIELAPRIALTGHGDPVEDPAGRARELLEHHDHRLDETAAVLGREPRSAYEISIELFGGRLDASGRRFALAETLAHLERLVREGRAGRSGDSRGSAYTAA